MLVEVCANSPASAFVAQEAGANRIEFCNELAVGGVTPSRGQLEWIIEHIKIPVHVLIRPRSGDFCYSEAEFDCMIRDIKDCVSMGFAGIVSGCLTADRQIDIKSTEKLITAAGASHFTFHRAFDRCVNPVGAIKLLEDIGVDTLLTSGQAPGAEAGFPLLLKLLEASNKLVIMPGSGINAQNVLKFAQQGFSAIHLSGISKLSDEDVVSPGLSMNSPSLLREGRSLVTDLNTVSEVVKAVKPYSV
jgi:copper homeostasis protein